jgi:hypothetical protein
MLLSITTLGAWKHAPGRQKQPFVIVITSVARPHDAMYLADTLRSLHCALSAVDVLVWPKVVVVNADLPATRHKVFLDLHSQPWFQSFKQHGLQFVTVGHMHSQLHNPAFVAELVARNSRDMQLHQQGKKLPPQEGVEFDTADRFWWRSKEALDTAFALQAGLAADPGANYCIFLQDDIKVHPDLLGKLHTFVSKAGEPVDASPLWTRDKPTTIGKQPNPDGVFFGLVAVMFRREVATSLATYIQQRFSSEPVDWLVAKFLREHKLGLWVHEASIVQHVGLHSSLPGKLQPFVSQTFAESLDRGC